MLTKAKAKFDVVSIVNGAQSARRNIASNLDFINKYLDNKIPKEANVAYMNYIWTINE